MLDTGRDLTQICSIRLAGWNHTIPEFQMSDIDSPRPGLSKFGESRPPDVWQILLAIALVLDLAFSAWLVYGQPGPMQ